jgi:glycosidase
MKRIRLSPILPLMAGLACLIGPAAPSACVSIPQEGTQPVLATHVDDWRDEVIYQLLVDRFADGDVNNNYSVRPGELARYQGGDWKGIQDHLDYLTDLGVTTLWISPVVKNVDTDADVDGYHGYWAQDLTAPNPHFGDLTALRSMIAAAHDRGLKVVLDIVCNHMGQVFFYDINRNGSPDEYIGGTGGPGSPVTRITEYDPDYDPNGVQSFSSAGNAGRAPIVFINDPTINREPPKPGILGTAAAYHGKGHILSYDNINHQPDEEVMTGDFPGGLKDVATENPEVRATMVDAFATWVELADFDGFRIDTVKHVEHEFWTVFAANIRSRLAAEGKTNFLMFGEAFDGDDQLLGSYTQPGQLDSVFYFSQHYNVYRDIFEYAHDPTQQKGTSQIQTLWAGKKQYYGNTPQDGGPQVPPYKLLVNFLDNHDVARFLFDSNGDVAALRNALTLNMTADGIPCLYYGTEQDFSGGNDPANREILWTSNYATTGDTFTHFSKLARIRKAYIALRRGDTKVVWSSDHVAKESDAGIFAFERAGGDAGNAYSLVVLNTNEGQTSSTSNNGTTMKLSIKSTTLVDVLDPNMKSYQVGSDGTLNVSVPAQSVTAAGDRGPGMILIPQSDVVSGS